MRSIALSALLWALSGVALAHPPPPGAKMCDPLIALCFEPSAVHFEELPAKSPAAKPLGTGPHWIFGSAKTADGTVLFVTSTFERHYADCDAPKGRECPYETVPGFGAVVRVSGKKAKVLGTPDVVMHDTEPVPAEVVQALWADAAKRFVAAFGGAPALSAAMAAQKVDLADTPPAFREALKSAGVALPAAK